MNTFFMLVFMTPNVSSFTLYNYFNLQQGLGDVYLNKKKNPPAENGKDTKPVAKTGEEE